MALKDLVQTKETRVSKFIKMVISGSPKVGKTTFAQNAPNPIFIALENSDISLTADSFPKPATYEEVLGYLNMLHTEDHNYQSLVIDSVDWLIPLLDTYVVKMHFGGRGTIGSQGYGKGLEAQALEFRNFLNWLEVLSKKMHVIVVAHNKNTTINNPMLSEGYTAITFKLPEKCGQLLTEFADILGYAHIKLHTIGTDTVKVATTNERILGLEQSPAYPSGNRLNISNIQLDAGIFWDKVKEKLMPKAKTTATPVDKK